MSDDYWMERRKQELEDENNKPSIPPPENDSDYGNTKEEILHKIKELRIARSVIFRSAIHKAQAISDYVRKVAITEVKLKNGLIDKIDGIEIGKVTASAAHKIAEGICWKELFKKEKMEGLYKANISNIESIRAELNGLQSVNKHLE